MYNTEKYVRQCLDSIVKVKKFSYEIIAIDDGSKDNSYKVLEEYALNCKALVVLQNEQNSGVSFTRNRMIRIARGKYIAFVDSDDCIFSTQYEEMFQIIEKENADKINGGYIESSSETDTPTTGTESKSGKYKVYTAGQLHTPSSMCSSFINRTFLLENQLYFHENVSLSEDVLLNFEIAMHSKKLIQYDGCVYFYRQMQSSLMNGKRDDRRKKQNYISHYEIMKTYGEYYQQTEKYNPTLKTKYLLSRQNVIYFLIRIADEKYVKEQFQKLQREKYYPYPFLPIIFKSTQEPMWKRICLFLLPIKPFAMLLHIFMKRMSR